MIEEKAGRPNPTFFSCPASLGRRTERLAPTCCPPQRHRWGGIRVFADGGVMSHESGAHDLSVGEYADTSPAKLGRKN
jgi:hypothetical protein